MIGRLHNFAHAKLLLSRNLFNLVVATLAAGMEKADDAFSRLPKRFENDRKYR